MVRFGTRIRVKSLAILKPTSIAFWQWPLRRRQTTCHDCGRWHHPPLGDSKWPSRKSGQCRVDFAGTAHATSRGILRFSADGKTLTVGTLGGPIEVWDLTNAKRNRSIAVGPGETGIALGRNTMLTVSPTAVPGFPFGALGTSSVEHDPYKHIRQLAQATICPAGPRRFRLTTASSFRPTARSIMMVRRHQCRVITIRLWERSTAENILTIKGPRINTLTFSEDSRLFAAGDGNNFSRFKQEVSRAIALWNSLTGEKLHTLTGHTDDIACLAFAPGRIA